MQRHPALQELSRDHHHGLVYARRLRVAADRPDEEKVETARAFLEFWQQETSPHFREEEEILFPYCDRAGADLTAMPAAEVLLQHARIRGLVMELGDQVETVGPQSETLMTLGTLLDDHIRLEERVLFPAIEASVPEATLDAIGDAIATRARGCTLR